MKFFEKKLHVCPMCNWTEFYVTAHVTQDWKVNASGVFVDTINDCMEVTHSPNDEDLWCCVNCGHEVAGSDLLRTVFVSEDECTRILSADFIEVAGILGNGCFEEQEIVIASNLDDEEKKLTVTARETGLKQEIPCYLLSVNNMLGAHPSSKTYEVISKTALIEKLFVLFSEALDSI